MLRDYYQWVKIKRVKLLKLADALNDLFGNFLALDSVVAFLVLNRQVDYGRGVGGLVTLSIVFIPAICTFFFAPAA